MAKKKDSVALFEVISKSRERQPAGGMGVPSWMSQPPQEPEGAEPLRPAEPSPPGAALPKQPIVSTAEGRLQLSLNYVSGAVIVVALVVLLVLVFWLGRVTASSGPAETEAPAANNQPLPEIASGQPTPLQRVAGRYYLVIQGLLGIDTQHLEAANDIRNFLAAHGVPAEVRRYAGRPQQYIVWAYQGFDSSDSQDAQEHVRFIENLGQQYKAQGGRYDFRQGRIEDRPKGWFIQAPK